MKMVQVRDHGTHATATFADGSTVSADVVIGPTGPARSPGVRPGLHGDRRYAAM
jgi:hypothetical protein